MGKKKSRNCGVEAKRPLTPASYIGEPGFTSWLHFSSSFLLMCTCRQLEVIVQTAEALPPTWETWLEFPSLAGPDLAVMGIWGVNQRVGDLPASFCLFLPIILPFKQNTHTLLLCPYNVSNTWDDGNGV